MSERNRYNVLWAPGKAGEANKQAKAHGLKHVPYEFIDAQTDWRVYELPPGIAKKSEEWIRAHPHFGGEFEPEGFGEAIPIQISQEVAEGAEGGSLGVPEVDEWYQLFVKVPQAHTKTRGAGVTGAVFDNGLNPHPWLVGKIGEEKNFRATETNGTLGGSHGNPVTGCALAIVPEAKVTNFKIAGSADARCSYTDVSNGFLYAKQQGYKIFNLSYGGGSSILLSSTLKTCKDAGIAIFVAAGNSSTATMFPANNVHVYAVSSVATSGEISGFSCRGKINIAAPGEGLLTTNDSAAWGHFSGTSGASPIAFGVCLLVASQNPTWTGVQCAERVLATATPKLPTTDYGAGHANAAAAVGAGDVVVPPPPPPVDPPPPTTPPPTDKPVTPTNLRVTELTTTSFILNWDQAPYAVGINRWEVFGGDYRFESVEFRYGPDVKINRAYGTGPRKQWLRVKAVGNDGADSGLSIYLDESLPPGETPPPPPPPPPNAVEAQVAAIETAWPTLSAADRTNTKSRIAALP